MTSDIIVPIVESRPFRPFEMHVVDGRVFRVPHSDFVTLERLVQALSVYDEEGFKEIIDASLIVSIKILSRIE